MKNIRKDSLLWVLLIIFSSRAIGEQKLDNSKIEILFKHKRLSIIEDKPEKVAPLHVREAYLLFLDEKNTIGGRLDEVINLINSQGIKFSKEELKRLTIIFSCYGFKNAAFTSVSIHSYAIGLNNNVELVSHDNGNEFSVRTYDEKKMYYNQLTYKNDLIEFERFEIADIEKIEPEIFRNLQKQEEKKH